MAKKTKQKSQKSLKKTLRDQVESRLSESLKDLPKKISEKKFRKTLRKAGKILIGTLATKPVKVASKTESKKAGKKKRNLFPKRKQRSFSLVFLQLHFLQILPDKTDGHRAFPYGRRNTGHGTKAHITCCKYPGHTGLRHIRISFQRPDPVKGFGF